MGGPLSRDELAAYRRDGFVRLAEAFPRALALRCRDVLWDEIEEARDDPATWSRPVVRIHAHTAPELSEAAASGRWRAAIRQVAGPHAAPTAWMGGTTAVRFPVEGDPGDDGWHVDGSYVGPDGRYWLNHRSRDRALLMLVLFSDVGPDDAPTRIRVGAHRDVGHALVAFGEQGVASMDFLPPPAVHGRPLALATGSAGDVYLCHQFLVHAAQRHRGTEPRFLAQPGVPWSDQS